MPQKDFGRSFGRGKPGAGAKRMVTNAKAKGAALQGKVIARKANSMITKLERETVKEANTTARRAATARRHPSGKLIDPRDGTVLNPDTMKVFRPASKANRARARVNMVKNSPAAKDIKKVAKKVSNMKKKRGK
jgi:hypothetical protein